MPIDRRHMLAGVIAAALALGCGFPADDGPTDEEILAAGTAELDAVKLPEHEWAQHARYAKRDKTRLVWKRWYTVPLTREETVRLVDRMFTEAGWVRGDDCLSSDGEKCFNYDKPGYHVFPSITDRVCADGGAGCTDLQINMRRR
ncbi:hypothetical protein CS0771_41420 [Catellatospora sp. IY07-71]|uniref:hypothetical protein n=1 Tax=Catellatospora sp. IY07-71 TaxID=2728827 RepID=UPI001BB3E4EA|nr:hypothetical protein [Catellatospora sp. IY07-71]BCJ74598.1 hypothetical protein CS0771_41420 [Catellatospora sp. IY07-71]